MSEPVGTAGSEAPAEAPLAGAGALPLSAEEERLLRPSPATYTVVRFWLLRGIGLVYVAAFAAAVHQLVPLVGERGILPARWFLDSAVGESHLDSFLSLPTVFWLDASDGALRGVALFGLAGSLLVLFGASNAILQAALWASYLSIVHVGQVWYAYGWEILLLEAGFLSIFLASPRSLRPFAKDGLPHPIVVWLFRWLIVRVMLGAGLIKLRGDPCWRDLTCLVTHYETQPNPHPLSPLFHAAPAWFHAVGVLANHVVELVAPCLVAAGRRGRIAAGVAFVAFQLTLIASGNLSFLNWITLVVAIACFDDEALRRTLPARWRPRAEPRAEAPRSRVAIVVAIGLGALVAVLSLDPLLNLVSPRQRMNSSFDRLHLVNTYGAFGSIDDQRHELVIEGTRDAPADPRARWLAYELPCKPGDPERSPCLITPYHLRLDWQLWFPWHRRFDEEGNERCALDDWVARFVHLLLRGERSVAPLLARDPFASAAPPRAIRIDLYRYRMKGPLEDGTWERRFVEHCMPPVTAHDPRLRAFLEARGWSD